MGGIDVTQDHPPTYSDAESVSAWLAVLRDEGALVPGDLEQQARFLLTVVNGRSLERAIPGAQARLAHDLATLEIAVSAVVAAA